MILLSNKTKIVVLRTKDLIYAIIVLLLIILLAFFLLKMFHKQPDDLPEDYNASISSSKIDADASLGIRRSPLGDTATLPTFGPSGRQDLLNC